MNTYISFYVLPLMGRRNSYISLHPWQVREAMLTEAENIISYKYSLIDPHTFPVTYTCQTGELFHLTSVHLKKMRSLV